MYYAAVDRTSAALSMVGCAFTENSASASGFGGSRLCYSSDVITRSNVKGHQWLPVMDATHIRILVAVMLTLLFPTGGLYLGTNNFDISDMALSNNSAFYGGSLYIAANLASNAALSGLSFDALNTAMRGDAFIGMITFEVHIFPLP